ncbi:hypothetical protein A6E15_19275 [Natrinema saccharevitans]|uniref:Uncharacterized protein n=1 Tax=Natrinema saccharevitans TaxID=301967 RepID=A0A1S8AR48_9EURY|nr:hypothetical protein [Natrinema saccharevitans]OLZ39107.1 hypothetical protein A6E15_19275 [Natrinema saccharevitans]
MSETDRNSRYAATSEDFDFEAGDRVLVRVREHGDSGNIEGKFEATVEGFETGVSAVSSDRAVFDPPWDSISGVKFRYYEAEFEVLDDAE